jgi:hypothetical protein
VKNAYIREDRVLPHLPALHQLLAGPQPSQLRRRRTRHGMDVTAPAAGDVIAYLRQHEITLTYHPAAATLQASTCETATTFIGKPAKPQARNGPAREGEPQNHPAAPASAQARAWVTFPPARKRASIGFFCVRGGT